eukprot:14340448-Ditylum_brightwellii.AAC.1
MSDPLDGLNDAHKNETHAKPDESHMTNLSRKTCGAAVFDPKKLTAARMSSRIVSILNGCATARECGNGPLSPQCREMKFEE